MTTPQLRFAVEEQLERDWLRLSLTGELDLAVAPELEERLARLRAESRSVLLDLSRLEFIDSSGLHVLIDAINHSRSEGWGFEIDPSVPPQVLRALQLASVDRFILGTGGYGN